MITRRPMARPRRHQPTYPCERPGCKRPCISSDIDDCRRCNQHFCRECTVTIKNSLFCEPCALAKQFEDLQGTLFDALQALGLDEKVVNVLALYSNGFAFECCNQVDACDATVMVDNVWLLKQKRDCLRKKISYYAPKYMAESRPTVQINYKHFRIFCSRCVGNKLSKCVQCRGILETGAEPTCGKHALCPVCARGVVEVTRDDIYHAMKIKNAGMKCKICRRMFCKSHIVNVSNFDVRELNSVDPYKCANCLRRAEYKSTRRAVQLALDKMDIFHVVIIQWIAEYAMGYSLKCSVEECNQELHIDDFFHFCQQSDFTFRDKIGKNLDAKHLKYIIYGREGVILCRDHMATHHRFNSGIYEEDVDDDDF